MPRRSTFPWTASGHARWVLGLAWARRHRAALGRGDALSLALWIVPGLLIAAGLLYLNLVEDRTLVEVEQRLAQREHRSAQEFDAWMDGRVQQARRWAARGDTRALATALAALKDPTPEQLNNHPLQAAFRAEFGIAQGREGLHGYFVIDDNGLSLGAPESNNTGTPNLLWQESEFVLKLRSGSAALSPLMASDVALQDAGAYIDGKPLTLFVGVPLALEDGQPRLYFTIRIPVVGLLAQQGRARFGQGGISFLADRHGRLHADRSWLNLDLREHGLHSEPFRGRNYIFARDPGANLLTGTAPAQADAAAGRSSLPLTRSVAGLQAGNGSSLEPYRDHRGVPVVGTWRWDERLGLGIVTEMPAAEAFAPVAAARQRLVGAVAVLALLGLAALLLRLHRSRRELKSALINAEAASRAKGIFVANMSHEIRTPLNAVLGIAHLMGSTPLNAAQRNYLQMISSSGGALLAILNDILDYAKVEAGKLELLTGEFSLYHTMDSLASIMCVSAAPKDIELVIGIEPDVPCHLIGDSHRLLQILINLTGNAIKFTKGGEVVLRVSQLQHADGKARLRFEVRDTGIGIPADRQTRLFSAFSQADAGVAREFGGTGLGLAICKRLVDLMQGEIGVDSTVGVGSSFWFVLPLGVNTERIHERASQSLGIKHVMLVDDNDIAREFVAKSVERLGWQPASFGSGAAAIERLKRKTGEEPPCDVALIDWSMPDMDGLQTSAAIRSLRLEHTLPIVIMVTAFGREQVLSSPLATAIDAVIDKPTTPSKILDAVMEARAKRHGGYVSQRAPYDPPRPAMRLQGLHILLAEDNFINQQVARGLLVAEGARVHIVEHGAAAVEALAHPTVPIDLVLMDVQMPVMDGLDATRQIRARRLTAVPVIAMSAGVTAEEQRRCREAGMDAFIAKPIDAQTVVQTIRGFGLPGRRADLAAATAPSPGTAGKAANAATGAATVLADSGAATAVSEPIDMEALDLALNGDRALLRRLLLRFEQECDRTLSSLEAVMAEGKTDKTAHLLHALKGMAANMRAGELTDCAARMEALLRSDGIAALNAQLATLRGHVDAVKDFVSARSEA